MYSCQGCASGSVKKQVLTKICDGLIYRVYADMHVQCLCELTGKTEAVNYIELYACGYDLSFLKYTLHVQHTQ